jgi:glutathione synthase
LSLRLGIVMDPIQAIKIHKDSSFAMLLEAQLRGYSLHYMNQQDISLSDGRAFGRMRPLRVTDDSSAWFELGEPNRSPLADLDVLLMRKDPPFDMEYVHDTHVLDRAVSEGLLVINRPQALRDASEKVFTAWFPQCCPPTLIARDPAQLREFVLEQETAVIKPLDGMGGESIFCTDSLDKNLNVILETVGQNGRRLIMAQRYIPEIVDGDKRILLIDGEPVPYALARLPSKDDFRGNLAKGGRGEGVPLSDRDRWICEQVGPELKRRGVLFAGLDVIGDYLTEINVTSPTCIRELDGEFGLNIAGQMFDRIESTL